MGGRLVHRLAVALLLLGPLAAAVLTAEASWPGPHRALQGAGCVVVGSTYPDCSPADCQSGNCCEFVRDGECDEPGFCAAGTDSADCPDYCECAAPERCETAGGTADAGARCAFPMVYDGVSYSACTSEGNSGVPWCYTGDGTSASAWGNCLCGAASDPGGGASRGTTLPLRLIPPYFM